MLGRRGESRCYPAVLGVARRCSGLLVELLYLIDIVARYWVSLRLRVDPVNARRIQAEDLPLDLRAERLVAELLHQRAWHLQAAQRLDLPLRRAPPDRIGAPQDVVGPESVDHHSQYMAAQERLRDGHQPERAAQL